MNPNTTQNTHYLTFAVEPAPALPGTKSPPGPVRFRGIAYSGGIIPRYGWHGDAAIDLATLTLPPVLFALVDHDPGQRAGKCQPRREGDQIIVEGELFEATAAGREVAALLKAGAPWQMSVGIQAEARSSDPPAVQHINGQDLTLNTLFAHASLREVSFVPVGADPNTSVAAFARPGQTTPPNHPNQPNQSPPPQGSPMEIDALKAQVAELQAANTALKTQAEQAQSQLNDIKLAARQTAITALATQTGQTFNDTQKADFARMDDGAFNAMSSVLVQLAGQSPSRPATSLPAHLFSEQATHGKAPEGQGSTTATLSATAIYAHRAAQSAK